MVMNV